MENIQDSCQSSQEWTSHQVHPEVRENAKKPTTISIPQTLQASVRISSVKGQDSIIRKKLKEHGLFGMVARREKKVFLSTVTIVRVPVS